MARVSDAQTNAEGCASSSSTALASRPDATVSSTRDARPVVDRPRARSVRDQPDRRSSPSSDSLRQPIQAIRSWPLSIRWVGGQLGAGRAVDVDPRVPGVGVVPRPAEGDERRPPLVEPVGLRVAEVGVGHDEGVDRGRAEQVVVAGQLVLGVAGVGAGEQQHVVAGRAGRLDQRVHEPVHLRVGGALLDGLDRQADQVRGAGAQVAGRAVGQVAQLGDRLLHPLQGVVAQQLGVVDGVGHGLAGDAGALGDVGQGRRRDRQPAQGPRHAHLRGTFARSSESIS